MKLFHWEQIEALKDYYPGEVIVMAETEEMAIELACTNKVYDCDSILLRQELTAKKPVVTSKPTAILVLGGS